MGNTLNLTKFSERNLQVIQNFLLYAGLEDEYNQTAIDYIQNDHVDGEDSPQALIEKAKTFELILDDIFQHDDELETFPCDVYYDSDSKLFYLISNCFEDVIEIYKMTKEQEVIEKEHRAEILAYRLARFTDEDEVSVGDIFMHGKYVEKVN